MKNYKIINYCQISGSKKLDKILDLGFLPPVNEMFKFNKKNISQNFFETGLFFCKKSKLVQINTIVDKKIIFPKTYPYTSSSTKILRDNFENLSNEIRGKFNLKKKFIVDIGSNDGNLLSFFKKDFKVLGITPEDVGKIAIKRGIPTILDYFNNKIVKKIKTKFGQPDVITATNVFAHIENPKKLLKDILKLLDKDGIFVTESHYLIPLIEKLQYDTIYHEHLRYYSLSSLKYLFSLFNLRIIEAKKIPTHGGSIRVTAAKNKKFKQSKEVDKILKLEKKYLNIKRFQKFKDDIVLSKLNLNSLLFKIKKGGKLIFGIGAPSRASTLINYVGIDHNVIENVLEIKGSKKIGKYVPGTKIPIFDENLLYKNKPDYVLIFSWHIANEIILNLKKKGYRGKFIIPLPNPKILS